MGTCLASRKSNSLREAGANPRIPALHSILSSFQSGECQITASQQPKIDVRDTALQHKVSVGLLLPRCKD
ncbi:hypothetical protein Y1Q_0001006 [Alligator mississippiensis]|uniref:Uncharacterized protein n=1 Tax=Alligator mississippiensis TaxID=8496 RepID=A0A151NE92_ALLMI|nr:hypothetical protein Y1Q_0001006 [Alligator mississippiensis]